MLSFSALVALKNLGIDPKIYFASEIDEISKIISAKNYGDQVIQLGNIKDITEEDIVNYCPINLLIGGSPCNDLSLVNRRKKGLNFWMNNHFESLVYFEALLLFQSETLPVRMFLKHPRIQEK